MLLGMLTMLITLLLDTYHRVSHTNKRKKIFYDLGHYFWDDPRIYKGVDGIIRRCIREHEQEQILWKCHSEAYGGHLAGDITAHKVLQSGFYWPTLFKDARTFVLSCDESQRIGNIGKHQEIPMNYLLLNHLMFGALTLWDLFLPLMGIHIFWLLLIMLLNG